jgi:hypothetical protein
MRQSQLDSCITFLEVYRKLTRFVLIEAQDVKLVTRKCDQQSHPQVLDQTPLFEERNAADARLATVISSGSPIRMAAEALNMTFRQLVHARAEFGYGGVPADTVSSLRRAEDRFSQAVYEQLISDRITGDPVPRRSAQRLPRRLGTRRTKIDAPTERSL